MIREVSTIALPHLCLHCQKIAPIDQNPAVCEECLKIHWKSSRCSRCGSPCHPDEVSRPRCYRCRHIQLPFDAIQSMGPYTGWLREAILQYKYFQNPLAKRFLVQSLSHLSALGTEGQEICTFIPSHKKRLKERRTRQQHMEELVRSLPICKNLDLVCLLEKKHFQKAQVELSGDARRKAVDGSLAYIGPKTPPACVHLFDDVWTTGSTIREASRVLKEAGVNKVLVHVIAWTSHPNIQ